MWLKDIDRQIEAQACSSSMTKLTPDEGYTGMYYLVHPDYLNRLLEIVERAEWGPDNLCPICSADEFDDEGHWNDCPYSNEYKGG